MRKAISTLLEWLAALAVILIGGVLLLGFAGGGAYMAYDWWKYRPDCTDTDTRDGAARICTGILHDGRRYTSVAHGQSSCTRIESRPGEALMTMDPVVGSLRCWRKLS
jgi:hypothetical protein